MKLLLYCTKSKPYLLREDIDKDLIFIGTNKTDVTGNILNGKIIAECDFEVEEIYYGTDIDDFWTKTCGSQKDIKHNLLKQSCLAHEEMYEYLQPKDSYYGDCGYAIHIKNLKIFDKPRELIDFHRAKSPDGYSPCWHCKRFGSGCYSCNIKAPQNMMYVFDGAEKKVLISIRPEWLCKILNGEKTIEVRKKVLKEMER